jgi:quinol monooxygenase YgiN
VTLILELPNLGKTGGATRFLSAGGEGQDDAASISFCNPVHMPNANTLQDPECCQIVRPRQRPWLTMLQERLREAMAIRHVITIQVAPGKAAEFASAFRVVQASAYQEEGCEQYELFQSLDHTDKLVLLERWSSRELLDAHLQAERTRTPSPVDALVALWAPGVNPVVERFEA